MMDRVLLWEISQIRRSELLNSAKPVNLRQNFLPSVVAGIRGMIDTAGLARPAWIHRALPHHRSTPHFTPLKGADATRR
jgi:hypothetical protein